MSSFSVYSIHLCHSNTYHYLCLRYVFIFSLFYSFVSFKHVSLFLISTLFSGYESGFEKLSEAKNDLQKTCYDYGSVMHYARDTWAIDSNTILPCDASQYSLIGQRDGMSPMDIERVRLLYGCVEVSLWNEMSVVFFYQCFFPFIASRTNGVARPSVVRPSIRMRLFFPETVKQIKQNFVEMCRHSPCIQTDFNPTVVALASIHTHVKSVQF